MYHHQLDQIHENTHARSHYRVPVVQVLDPVDLTMVILLTVLHEVDLAGLVHN